MSKLIKTIENFYEEIFGQKLYLQSEFFPLRKGWEEYNYNSGKFDVNKILSTYSEKFGYGFDYAAGAGHCHPTLKIIEGENKRQKNRYTFSYQKEFPILNDISGKKAEEVFGKVERYANAVEMLLILGMNMYKYKSFRAGLPDNFNLVTSSRWYYIFQEKPSSVSVESFNNQFTNYVVIKIDEEMKRISLDDLTDSRNADFVCGLPKQILLREE